MFIPEIHCLHGLCIPNYYSRDDKPNKNIRSCCINNRFNILLNNKKILSKINEGLTNSFDIQDIYIIKRILNQSFIKTKVLQPHQEEFMCNIMESLKSTNDKRMEKLELIYKHFNEFMNEKELKTKNFTIKFKEKLKKLNNTIN